MKCFFEFTKDMGIIFLVNIISWCEGYSINLSFFFKKKIFLYYFSLSINKYVFITYELV